MPYSTEQVLLTLAGLAYRGFHDLLRGAPHADTIRGALLDGLHALPPVKDEWILVWGPVTSRSRPDAFDSAAMYVVQHRREPTRYVVVIRGTNPISASDWLDPQSLPFDSADPGAGDAAALEEPSDQRSRRKLAAGLASAGHWLARRLRRA